MVLADAVDDAVEATGKSEWRRGGKLPPTVVTDLVMALALFADEDYEEVAAQLAGTLADWEEPWGGYRPRAGSRRPGSGWRPEPTARWFTSFGNVDQRLPEQRRNRRLWDWLIFVYSGDGLVLAAMACGFVMP